MRGVGRRDDRAIPCHSRIADVFDAIVARAGAAVLESAAHANDSHREIVQDGAVANELVRPEHRERDDRIAEGNESRVGQTGGNPDHVLLGDTHVVKAIGKAIAEGLERHKAEIASQQYDPLVLLRRLEDRLNESGPHAGSPISLIAWSKSDSDIGR